MKTFWRCFICNDIHYGVRPPDLCPTCNVRHAYVRISAREAADLQEFPDAATKAAEFTPEEFSRAIEEFCQGQEFQVNPDRPRVDLLIEGLFGNAANHGLKYCPCRLRTKERGEDLKLVCPCSFTGHETYRGKAAGECWCGLFVKRR